MLKYTLTNEQARHFILFKQGLLGDYKFRGKQGVCDFVKQAGCIQFDPIDVCGKNAELVLQSRVLGFSKEMLNELLYTDRKLIDYFDKNMAIFGVEDWKYFARCREEYRNDGRSRNKVDAIADELKRTIKEKGTVSSKDIHLNETVDWAWNPTSLSRAALETLYFRGDLIIHHKKGTIKQYALADDYLSNSVLQATDPNTTEDDFIKWQVLRRIGSVGLLWNKPSDAWLGISGFKSDVRGHTFLTLIAENRIIACHVDGIASELYFLAEDESLMQTCLSTALFPKRLELIAPLDNMMWDRKLIRSLFDFDYKWEIYTPIIQRKYGYYVLPVLYGSQFAGRAEIVVDKKQDKLIVQNFWPEEKAALDQDFYQRLHLHFVQFANFNQCKNIEVQF